jgi:hypothetical protein
VRGNLVNWIARAGDIKTGLLQHGFGEVDAQDIVLAMATHGKDVNFATFFEISFRSMTPNPKIASADLFLRSNKILHDVKSTARAEVSSKFTMDSIIGSVQLIFSISTGCFCDCTKEIGEISHQLVMAFHDRSGNCLELVQNFIVNFFVE